MVFVHKLIALESLSIDKQHTDAQQLVSTIRI